MAPAEFMISMPRARPWTTPMSWTARMSRTPSTPSAQPPSPPKAAAASTLAAAARASATTAARATRTTGDQLGDRDPSALRLQGEGHQAGALAPLAGHGEDAQDRQQDGLRGAGGVDEVLYVSSSGGAANMKIAMTAAVSRAMAMSSQRPARVSTSLRSSPGSAGTAAPAGVGSAAGAPVRVARTSRSCGDPLGQTLAGVVAVRDRNISSRPAPSAARSSISTAAACAAADRPLRRAPRSRRRPSRAGELDPGR